MKTVNLIIAAALFSSVITACEKEELAAQPQSSSQATSPTAPPGAKAIKVNSSPGENSHEYRDCFIEIDKVEAFTQSQGWIIIRDEDQTINLTQANLDAAAMIATMPDTTFDRIEKIRLTFGDNNFLTSENGDHLQMALANSNELLIEVDREGISQESEIILHFDLNQALSQQAGAFIFDPVIDQLEDPETGISGSVSGTAQALISLDSDHASYQTFLTADGQFMIRDIEEGSYRLLIQPLLSGLNDLQAKIINVVVVDGRITSTGHISFN
ncbi:MAG: hypothetical protein K0R65_2067 [Crocinitomicaceae bacterium]|nr:hypothetical protein [Crocinitomicaceae bacterium]